MVGRWMTYERFGGDSLEYYPCRYGEGKTLFRGPKAKLDRPYAAFVGSSEFYGKFVEHPFPELIQEQTGRRVVNLGLMNAGVDAFLYDEPTLRLMNEAQVTFLQILPAHNMSNRFYKVHPRRNDRFLKPSVLMQTLFQEVDFSDFHFTRHLLLSLHRFSPDKFQMVVDELRNAWTARMRLVLARITGPKILVHITDETSRSLDGPLGSEPLFVTDAMVEDIAQVANGVIKYDATATRARAGSEGMVCSEMEAQIAAELLPPACHKELTDLLAPRVCDWL